MKNKLLNCYFELAGNKLSYIAKLLYRKSSNNSARLNNSTIKQCNDFKEGFTLVEIILYMALVTIFTLTLTDIFVAILDVKTESEATSAVEQDGRFILARLAYDLPQASSITTPASLGSSASTLVMTISATTYTYALSGSDLNLTIGAGTNKLNGSETSISGLSFKKLGNLGGKETITAQFTITSKTQRPQGPEIRIFTTTLERR